MLPIQIFNWVSRPQADFHANAAAGILVLLALLLSMNAAAIWLRDRYQKRGAHEHGVPTARIARRAPRVGRRQTAGRPSKIDVDSELLLRREAGARGHLDPDQAEPRHRVHRSVGLRQEHVPAHAEPDERHHPGHARRGPVLIDGVDIYESGMDVVQLRRRVGMVFQKSNPFPKSIFENVAYGLRINGMAGTRRS